MNNLKIYRLLKKDVFSELQDNRGIYRIDMEVLENPAYSKEIKSNSLSDIFKSLEMTGASLRRIILTTDVKNSTLESNFVEATLSAVKTFGTNLFKKAQVKYISGDNRRKLLDLLAGRLDASVSVQTEEKNTRYLDSKSMFVALRNLYHKEEPILRASKAVCLFSEKHEASDNTE